MLGFVRNCGIYSEVLQLAFTFKSTKASNNSVAMTYTGKGSPLWTDGTQTIIGTSGTFNWTDSTEKEVLVYAVEPNKITGISQMNSDLISEMFLNNLVSLGGVLNLSSNVMTMLEFPISTEVFTNIDILNNDIDELDISTITISGSFSCRGNDMSTLTTGSSSESITNFTCRNNDISSLDLSGYSDLSGIVDARQSPNLASVSLPTNTNTFDQFVFSETAMGVVDFSTLSAISDVNNHLTRLDDCGMTAAEVNENLVNFDAVSSGGYTGRVFEIDGGSNAAPDSSSGGFDGDAAVTSLVGKGFTINTN